MKKSYNKSIGWLIVTTIFCFFMYVLTYEISIVSTIFANMSVGLITGFIILIITNLKNSLIYQNTNRINELRDMIDKSRDYEIKVLNFKNLKEVPIIQLIYIYADLANLFNEINNYNEEFYNINKYECKRIVNECDEMQGKLSEIMSEVNINQQKYDKEIDWDLSKKILVIFKLRRNLQSELKLLEQETQKLYKSII